MTQRTPDPIAVICKTWSHCSHPELCQTECFDADLSALDKKAQRAQISEFVRGSYAEAGVEEWWVRPRGQLGGRTPEQALQDGDYEKVLELAKWLLGPGNGT